MVGGRNEEARADWNSAGLRDRVGDEVYETPAPDDRHDAIPRLPGKLAEPHSHELD